MNPSPCGCDSETLEKYNKFDDCTTKYPDKSGQICGEPLGAHPQVPQGKNILLF
jgi:hypothetical protein